MLPPAPAGIDGGQSSLAWLPGSWTGLGVLQADGVGTHEMMGHSLEVEGSWENDIFGAVAWIRPSDLEALGGADRGCFCHAHLSLG